MAYPLRTHPPSIWGSDLPYTSYASNHHGPLNVLPKLALQAAH